MTGALTLLACGVDAVSVGAALLADAVGAALPGVCCVFTVGSTAGVSFC